MTALQIKGISPYLRRQVRAFLLNRRIMVDSEGGLYSSGVPQYSVLGPLLWNIVHDGVLNLRLTEGVKMVAYSDDLAVLAEGKKEVKVQDRGNEALRRIQEWMTEQGLELAPAKFEYTTLTGRRRISQIDLRIGQHRI